MKTLILNSSGRSLLPVVAALLALAPLSPAVAQVDPARAAQPAPSGAGGTPLDSLLSAALAGNPSIRAAARRVEAARARVRPAGALPDPMLTAGIQNLPLGRERPGEPGMAESGPDPMTMRMIGIGQTLPYPGKLALQRRAAEHEVAAAEAELEVARWRVREEVIAAYADLALLDHSLEVLTRNQAVLSNLVRVTEARYGVGTGGQSDVLRARVELTRLAETAVALHEQRRAAAARLNALLDRPSDTPVERAPLPERIARAAVAPEAERIRFSTATLGSRAADSPLPPLAELQEMAVRWNPRLRVHEAMVGAQAARVELAGRAHLPDFDLSLQYGQRPDRPDMLSAMVSVPLPIQRGRKQAQEAAAAGAELAALRAEHQAKVNEMRAEVARMHSELERERARLALFVRSILPQGRAALESATAGFQVGRVDFTTLLENQATLFDYETEYYRALTDFATTLARLESTVGKELLP